MDPEDVDNLVEVILREIPSLEFTPTVGSWPMNDLRRAFAQGAKWWEFHKTQATMWQSDQQIAEEEADKRYPKEKES